MNQKEFDKEFKERQQQQQLEALDANRNRAQSVSIGMSGSGTTEITMRGVNGTFLWNIYQPVQVTEFIHQLAASIGCHIHLQPREDFGSYREWRESTEAEKLHLNGFPPFAGQIQGSHAIGLIKEDKVKENVAIKKTVNKRRPKRSKATSR